MNCGSIPSPERRIGTETGSRPDEHSIHRSTNGSSWLLHLRRSDRRFLIEQTTASGYLHKGRPSGASLQFAACPLQRDPSAGCP
jgi:hypothetical protein